MKKFLVFLCAMFAIENAYAACSSDKIDVTGDGTNCTDAKFTVTTTATDSFHFQMSAAGNFIVDCGPGGTLDSDANDVSGKTITRSDTTTALYTCSYTNNTTHTIRFTGTATGYTTGITSAIRFNADASGNDENRLKLTGISGSLGAIFGTVSNPSTGTNQPIFSRTFYLCSNITGTIPENLFAGIHGETLRYMFYDTFNGCSGLTGSIPEKLFCQNPENPDATNCIYGAPASYMFYGTFSGCSGLTGSIPEKLFIGIHGAPATSMFSSTFNGCSGLTGSIPEKLFCQNPDNPNATNCIYGAPAQIMFDSTFSGCSGLTGSIPEKLFAGIHGTPAQQMFNATFWGCSGLTGSIPEKLFCQNPDNPNASNCIYGAPASAMFQYTFNSCTNLNGKIPTKLFAGIRGAATVRMFNSTFLGCYNLNGFTNGNQTTTYVPGDFLSAITDAEAEYKTDNMFRNTGLAQTCPTGTTNTTRAPFSGAGKPWCTTNTITISWDSTDSEDIAANDAGSVTYGGDIRTPKKAVHKPGKIFTGWTFNAQ